MLESHLILAKPWRLALTILIGGTRDELYKAFRKRRVSTKESAENADYCLDQKKYLDGLMLQTNSRPQCVFIYFPNKPTPHDAGKVDIIAHELLHVTFYMLSRTGVKFSTSSEEAFCHAHGQLMYEFWTRVFPKQPKTKYASPKINS